MIMTPYLPLVLLLGHTFKRDWCNLAQHQFLRIGWIYQAHLCHVLQDDFAIPAISSHTL